MAAFCRHFISQSIGPFGGQKHRCLLRAGKRGIMEKEQLVSRKKILSVAFAYVGILTGAGLASGRELVQYFISFGRAGMAGIVIIAVLYMLFGKMILSLGSYYRAQNHSDVLEQVSHPIVSRILDGSMIFSCFILSFVMIAGAGSSLGQQFSIPSWIGSLICAGMILAVSYMEFDQVIGALGIFTPMILLIILAAFFTVLTGDPVPWKEMLETGRRDRVEPAECLCIGSKLFCPLHDDEYVNAVCSRREHHGIEKREERRNFRWILYWYDHSFDRAASCFQN